MIPGEHLSVQCAITYDAVFNSATGLIDLPIRLRLATLGIFSEILWAPRARLVQSSAERGVRVVAYRPCYVDQLLIASLQQRCRLLHSPDTAVSHTVAGILTACLAADFSPP